jgi:hypothetical protein
MDNPIFKIFNNMNNINQDSNNNNTNSNSKINNQDSNNLNNNNNNNNLNNGNELSNNNNLNNSNELNSSNISPIPELNNNIFNNNIINPMMNNMPMNNNILPNSNMYFNNNMNNMNYYNNLMNNQMYMNQGFGMNNNMYQMNPIMMNNNMSKEEQNTTRLKYLLGNIQQNLSFIMNDVNEIETILNNMKSSGLDNNPNFMMLQNQFNQIMNNMNSINNMNNMNNMNQNTKIDLIFRLSEAKDDDTLKEIIIHCDKNEFIKDVTQRYREVINDFNKNIKFIFNARNLNLELTVAESGLLNNSNIFVVRI